MTKIYTITFLISALAGFITTSNAMDIGYDYYIKPLKTSWQRLLENEQQKDFCKKYSDAQSKLSLAKRGINPKGEKVTYSAEDIQRYEDEYTQLVKEYQNTQEFQEYHKQVETVKKHRKERRFKKVTSDLTDLDTIARDITTHEVICGEMSTKRIQITPSEAAHAALLKDQLQQIRNERYRWSVETRTHQNPETFKFEQFPVESDSPYYKKIWKQDSNNKKQSPSESNANVSIADVRIDENTGDIKLNKKAKLDLEYYNELENTKFHDALQNLKELKVIAEYKWKQKSWWYRLWYSKSYVQQMSVIQNKIDLFETDNNTRRTFTYSHIPNQQSKPGTTTIPYCDLLLKARKEQPRPKKIVNNTDKE